jgi:AhpD family alkylhydroperoxidase
MMERLNLGKSAPDIYKAVGAVDRLVSEALASAGISQGFAHLLRLRASQINHCAYCIKVHTRDALASGEAAERATVLPAWRETDYFSAKERAALELVEAVTLISEGQVPDAVYERAAAVLSANEIVAIEWLAIVINSWNRIAISSRYPVRP